MVHKCDPFQLYGQEKDGTVVSTSQNSLLGDNKKFPILAAAGSEKVFDFYPGKITRNVYLLISFPISHHKILPRKWGSAPKCVAGHPDVDHRDHPDEAGHDQHRAVCSECAGGDFIADNLEARTLRRRSANI